MTIEIDFIKLKELDLTVNQFAYAVLLCSGEKELLLEMFLLDNEKKVKDDLYKLYQKGFISYEVDEHLIELNIDTMSELFTSLETSKVKELLGKSSGVDLKAFNEFFESWYLLFPEKIYTGGYPVRSGKSTCKAKMLKFIKEHKEFTFEIILQATRNFVERCKLRNYEKMQLSKNFIFKDKDSSLEAECEAVINGTGAVNNVTSGYGSQRG